MELFFNYESLRIVAKNSIEIVFTCLLNILHYIVLSLTKANQIPPITHVHHYTILTNQLQILRKS